MRWLWTSGGFSFTNFLLPFVLIGDYSQINSLFLSFSSRFELAMFN